MTQKNRQNQKLFALAILAFGLTAASSTIPSARAQDRAVRDDIVKMEEYRSSGKAIDAAGRELLGRVATYYASRLTDKTVQKDGMSNLIAEIDRKLTLERPDRFDRIPAPRRAFNEEFGKALTKAVLPVVTEKSKPIIARVNGARMLAEVARGGADSTAEAFLAILGDPAESDAVKFWALRGLSNLFAIVPEPLFPSKTVFQKQNAVEIPAMEQKCIQALIDFVNRKNDVKPDSIPEEVDAIRYVRREAIRALGLTRLQVVKNSGQVVSRPALTLLKVANRDGFSPSIGVGEQIDGIVGFCQLLPDRERDLQVDYATTSLARGLAEVGQYYINLRSDPSVPWKATAQRLRDALETWRKNSEDMKLANANLVKQLAELVEQNLLQPLEQTNAGVAPAVIAMREFADRQQLPPNASLFKSDPAATIKTTPWQ